MPPETSPSMTTELDMARQSKAAIAELARRHGKVVFMSAYRILGDKHLAEDTVQDVYLKLFRLSQKQWRSVDNWPAYLNVMSSRAALDVLRNRTRKREQALLPGDLDEQLGQPRSEPEQAHIDANAKTQLRHALASLAPADAQVFSLRHFQDMSYREIAQQLELSTNAVGVALNRAQRKLTKFFQSDWFEPQTKLRPSRGSNQNSGVPND